MLLRFIDTINKIDGGNRTVIGPTGTAGIFATYPADGVTMGEGFLDQVRELGVIYIRLDSINYRRYGPIGYDRCNRTNLSVGRDLLTDMHKHQTKLPIDLGKGYAGDILLVRLARKQGQRESSLNKTEILHV